MAKLCLNCELEVDDSVGACPRCKNILFNEIPPSDLKYIQLQAISELTASKLQSSWKFRFVICEILFFLIFGILGLITFAVGGSYLAYVQYQMKQFTAARVSEANSNLVQYVQTNLAAIETGASNRIDAANALITNHVNEVLQEPRYRKIVADVANGQSKAISEFEIKPTVDAFIAEANLDRTVAKAEAYDFKAYQELLNIGTQTNDQAKLADRVIAQIDRRLQMERNQSIYPRRSSIQLIGTNWNRGPFSADELLEEFPFATQNPIPENREGYVDSLAGLHRPLFMGSFMEILTNETDLTVADRATEAISEFADEQFSPHDFHRIQAWWITHQSKYTNYPMDTYSAGLQMYAANALVPAITNFDQVLKLDPGADKTRALDIVCRCQSGQTNLSASLKEGFAFKGERWEKWAGIMQELSIGNVSNATVELADFSKSYPAFEILPDRRWTIYSKVDWPLYNKLTSSSDQKP